MVEVSWQKAVGTLVAERGRAASAVSVIRRLGGAGEAALAALTYGTGKAEADAVIETLLVALQEGKGADDISELEARITQATAAREALGRVALHLAKGAQRERSVIADLLATALPDLLAAIGALWRRRSDRDAILRQTIAAQLETARWPAFAEIAPA